MPGPDVIVIGGSAGGGVLALLLLGLTLFFFWPRGQKEVAVVEKDKLETKEVDPEDVAVKPEPAKPPTPAKTLKPFDGFATTVELPPKTEVIRSIEPTPEERQLLAAERLRAMAQAAGILMQADDEVAMPLQPRKAVPR